MSKKDYYIVEKNRDKIIKGSHTNFLDPSTLNKVVAGLKGYDYKVYYPYNDCEKAVIYTKEKPIIKLLEITSFEKLTHREIMGSLYNQNIDSEMFGDIVIFDNHYYILVMNSICNIILDTFNMIGNKTVKIKEIDIITLDNYKREYEKKELIVSSLRIDSVISKLIGISRENIKKIFNNNEIFLNYEICTKMTKKLMDGDIFSIRKYGKYKYNGVIKRSKKNYYIIECLKYIN